MENGSFFSSARTPLRILVTFISTVGMYFFVYWFGGAILSLVSIPYSVSFILAAVAAILAGRYVWVRTVSFELTLVKSALLGGLVTGGIAFSLGFFGPMIFDPDANQGPLLGIFVTGPLGLVLGAVGGVVYWYFKGRGK